MIIKTRVFEYGNNGYKNLAELAQVMEISVSQIYRVREGKRHISEKFIVGAIKVFSTASLMTYFILLLSRHACHPGKWNILAKVILKHSRAQCVPSQQHWHNQIAGTLSG